jgi:hypothetical protein
MASLGEEGLVLIDGVRAPVCHGLKRSHHARRTMMRLYKQQHPNYCGVDLHTRKMFCCLLDQEVGRLWPRIEHR